MTDVARRQARTQKQRLDTALLDRRRRDALADLGESLYDLATRGEIELDELPELVRAVQAVEDIDQEIAEAELAASEASLARRPVRLGRTRAGGPAWPDRDREREPARSSERVWRPPVDVEPTPPRAASERRDRAAAGAAGGSRAAGTGGSSGKASSDSAKASSSSAKASSGSGASGKATTSAASGKATSGTGKATSSDAGKPSSDAGRSGVASGGGIVFLDDDSAPAERDPDDSLESYMNEEDVPRRG